MNEDKFTSVSDGAGVGFLRTELLAGFTRAKIAQATTDERKKQRNRVEGRKAYDAVVRYLSQTSLSPEEKLEIDAKIADLKFLLGTLGEVFQ